MSDSVGRPPPRAAALLRSPSAASSSSSAEDAFFDAADTLQSPSSRGNSLARYASALTSPIITVTPGTRTQTPTPGGSIGLCGDPETGTIRLPGGAAATVSGAVATSDDEDFDQERLLVMLRQQSKVLPSQIDVELAPLQKGDQKFIQQQHIQQIQSSHDGEGDGELPRRSRGPFLLDTDGHEMSCKEMDLATPTNTSTPDPGAAIGRVAISNSSSRRSHRGGRQRDHFSPSSESVTSSVVPDIVSSAQSDPAAPGGVPVTYSDSARNSLSVGGGVSSSSSVANMSTKTSETLALSMVQQPRAASPSLMVEPEPPPRRKKKSEEFLQFPPSPLHQYHHHQDSPSSPPSSASDLSPIPTVATLRPAALPVDPTSPNLGARPKLTAHHHQPIASSPYLPSPASTVASLTKDLESTLISMEESRQRFQQHSGDDQLNLQAALRGQFVVKPQDDEKSRGHVEMAAGDPAKHRMMDRTFSCPISNEDIADITENPNPSSTSAVVRRSIVNVTGGQSSSLDSATSKTRGASVSAAAASGSAKKGSVAFKHAGSMDSGRLRSLYFRTKSESMGAPIGQGSKMSDEELLKQIKVKNLNTGKEIALSEAEDKLPTAINPLSLHIMRLTSEYVSDDNPDRVPGQDSDTESMMSSISGVSSVRRLKKSSGSVKRFLGDAAKGVRKTADAAVTVLSTEVKAASEAVSRKTKKRDSVALAEVSSIGTSASVADTESTVSGWSRRLRLTRRKGRAKDKKLGRLSTEITAGSQGKAPPGFKRIQSHKSGPRDFEDIQFAQELDSQHLGPIWCMRFSRCGQLLATAGQDTTIRIWVVKDAYKQFRDMRSRYNSKPASASAAPDSASSSVAAGPTSSSPKDLAVSGSPQHETVDSTGVLVTSSYDMLDMEGYVDPSEVRGSHVFNERPFCSFQGHTSDVLDVCWSKNYFLLSSSMDKTVRLWHITRRECLCCFQHIDFVTALAFHPRNDQFFLSASLDGKLRLWNIPEKKVTLWNEVDGDSKLVTAANFIQNGKFAVVGTYDGRCVFYSTDQLKYHTMINVRSTRGKNREGRKVTGVEQMPGEDKILVTSNDSRIRIYDLRDLSLSCKFKGYTNNSSQIRASFSHDGKYITCGSENQCIFLWKSSQGGDSSTSMMAQANINLATRKDRNSYYEAIKAHNAVVTCSVFAPSPSKILEQISQSEQHEHHHVSDTSGDEDENGSNKKKDGYVVVSGDYDGDIKVFYVYAKPKQSSLPLSTSSAGK